MGRLDFIDLELEEFNKYVDNLIDGDDKNG